MIVCCTSIRSVGCTFLDWSIHFLSGQSDFFNLKNGWEKLSANPLTKINAHGHPKNVTHDPASAQETISKLQSLQGLTSFYPVSPSLDTAAIHLNLGPDLQSLTPEHWHEIRSYCSTSYNQALTKCNEAGAKIIFVALDETLSIYANTVRSLERLPFQNTQARSIQETIDTVDQLCFRDSIKKWQDLGLDSIWDRRERIALKKGLTEYTPLTVELAFDHYWIQAQNLWFDGDREIEKIFVWLGLEIDQQRFQAWLPIYRQWQKIQIDALQFQFSYKHIVDSIVNNRPYPINLTFEQEAIIQHCLIYDHGLNFKTWQLEKFPNNTQDLHKLLEPNIHPL